MDFQEFFLLMAPPDLSAAASTQRSTCASGRRSRREMPCGQIEAALASRFELEPYFISMEDLFVTQASNSHQTLLLDRFEAWRTLSHSFNRRSLKDGWRPLDFNFTAPDEKHHEQPRICTVYISGILAFEAALKAELFPSNCDQLEFLPINVHSKKWLLINCLKTITQYDEHNSQVMRGLNGEIFMITKLSVTDLAAKDYELFTLADSNRTQLLVRSSLKSRVEGMGLKGVTFKRIGEVLNR